MEDRVEVSRDIAASTTAVFALLCSPAGHVAIDASGMLQSAEGDPVTAVGASFVVHMDREALGDRPMGKYDATVAITAFEQDHLIEWTPAIEYGYRFGYRVEATATGCRATSYCDWSRAAESHRPHFPLIPATTLRASLGILARTVEAEAIE